MFIFASIDIIDIGLWLLYLSIPILIFYIAYLIVTKAFRYMGFTSVEAIIIVIGSLVLGIPWSIKLFEIQITNVLANIGLFRYGNWNVGINMGGAIIPIALSIYLSYKKKIHWKKILIGITIVSIVTYFVTYPDPGKGIVAEIPLGFLPAVVASILSAVLLYKDFKKAAPLAYISGTIGVLIGADVFHLIELLNHSIKSPTNAVIGGANVFDMVFITGIIAVVLDGIILFRQRLKAGIE